MSKSIPISPKHGLNPTIPICFFCGKPKNEIAILGKLKDDAEAPMHCILNTEPCEECQANMSMGYALLGITDTPKLSGQPKACPEGYLSGSFVVLSEQGVRHIFQPDTAENIISNNHKRIYIDDQVVQELAKQQEKIPETP